MLHWLRCVDPEWSDWPVCPGVCASAKADWILMGMGVQRMAAVAGVATLLIAA